jgi:endonuclease YncB( thermonuclease family)
VVRVIDGDTVDLSCPGRGTERARLTGFDTPEVFSPRCAEERALGDAATARLRDLVRDGAAFDISRSGYDDYGRALVRLDIDGRDVASTLISEGLAVRYTGGRRIDWCARLA